MTPADLARQNAIAFECKKDGLRQTQAGTWRVTFTVLDMDERLTRAFPGTRYQAVLVEIDDSELPVHRPAKETLPNPQLSNPNINPRPLPAPDKTAAKRMDWRELQPAAQCGIRCDDPVFQAFLREECNQPYVDSSEQAAEYIRGFCAIKSRSELSTDHRKRVLWKQLDDQFQAWKRVGA